LPSGSAIATTGRIIHIVPTKVGLEMLDRFDAARKALRLEALAPLSDDDLERLVHLMARIVDAPCRDALERWRMTEVLDRPDVSAAEVAAAGGDSGTANSRVGRRLQVDRARKSCCSARS